jgi:hypothetical protein
MAWSNPGSIGYRKWFCVLPATAESLAEPATVTNTGHAQHSEPFAVGNLPTLNVSRKPDNLVPLNNHKEWRLDCRQTLRFQHLIDEKQIGQQRAEMN